MFGKEPAVVLGALSEVVRAVIPTLIIFGIIAWTSEQVAQVMLLVGVTVKAIEIVVTRSQVVAVEKANAQILTATRMPEGTSVEAVIAKQERESN